MGESVAEATITKLVVSPSEFVESDEPLVEIATDKVDSEVPAPEDGTLVEWLVAEGDVVAVGQAIARFEIGGEATVAAAAPSAPAAVPTPAVVEAPTRVEAPVPSPAVLSAVSAAIGNNARTNGCWRTLLFSSRSKYCKI